MVYARCARVGATLTFISNQGLMSGEGVGSVLFLTRWGKFTDSSLISPWKYIGRVRMMGPWFDGDEVYAVLAARNLEGVSPYTTQTVTEQVDAEGVPLDAPLVNPEGYTTWGTSNSVARSLVFMNDVLTGEREVVGSLYDPDMPGYYTAITSIHIAQRDAASMLNYAEHMAIGTEQPLDPIRYRKHQILRYGDPTATEAWGVFYLRTRSAIRWADGTTEERIRNGADTKIQRIAIQYSDALATPSKPVITGGSPQWVNPTIAWTLNLTYASALAEDLTKLVWKRTIGEDVDYWNQTTQAWQATAFENTRSQPSQTFPIGAFPADSTFTIEVAAKGAVGGLSEFSDAVILDTNPIPTGTIGLTPYDTVTEVAASLSPIVTVGGEPAQGQSLEGYIVEVLNGDGQRWAHADVMGLSPWTIEPPLPNNTTGWVVRARVRQSGGALSDWVSLPFDVAAVVPGAPDVSAAPAMAAVSGLPVVRLTVDLPWETDGFDYEANPITLDVDRSTDEGGTWTPIGAVTPLPGWASGITLDDEAPSHLPAWYRVRASSTTQYGGELVGPWSVSVPAYPVDDGAWLSPVGFPELAVRVDLVTADEGRIVSGQSGAAVIGAPHQVVSGVKAVTGDGGYVARTDTPEDEAALTTLLAGGHLLTLSMTPERDSWNDTHAVPRRWFRVVGEIGVARVVQGPWTMRLVSWTATPQAAPATIGG